MRENWRKSYIEFFRYASLQDKFCTAFGLIAAIFAGICDPVIIILFGFMAQEFIDYDIQTTDLKKESIGHKWLERRSRTVNPDSLFDTTVYLGILTISIGCAEWILGTTFISALNYTAQRQVSRIRIEYFRAILRQEISSLGAHKPQELSMDIIRHTNNIFEALGEKLGILVCTAVASLASFTVALCYGWLLSLILFSIIPVIFIVGSFAMKISAKLKKAEQCSYEAAEFLAADCIVNIRSVAAYQGQRLESKSYSDSLSQCEAVEQRLGCFWGFVSGILWFIMYCSYSLAFYYGMLWCTVESGIFAYTPRDLITIFFSFQIGVMNLLQIPVYLKTIYTAEKSCDTVFSAIDKKFNIDSSSLSGRVLPNFNGSVVFNNIYFSYPQQLNTKVLQGVTFSIYPQQIIAFTGSSGSGKTTCLNLMCRFYDPQFGTVQFDGVDLPQLNLAWLRNKIGFVNEKNALFGATVGDAIRCGLPNISQNEIIDVARIVDVHDVIMSLPKKYSAPTASIVSDEIRKKLSIARALIRKPSVLILDNISMNLTADDESKILNSIIKHGVHKILIVVSTRLETLKMADKIIHLVNGVVVEEDSYAKLMENKKWFYHVMERKLKLGVKEINGEDTIEEFEPFRKSRLENLIDLNKSYYAKQNIYKNMNMKMQNDPDKTLSLEINPIIIMNCKKEKGVKCSLIRINMKEWLQLLIGCVAAALCGASLTVYAVLFGECLAVISRKTKQEFQPQLEFYTEMFLAAGILSGIALFVQGYVITASGVKLTKRLRQKTFDAILRQEMSWFDNEENCLANLLHMLKVDTANAQKVSGRYIVNIVQTSASLLASAILSFYYNWKLGICTFFFFPFMLLSMIYRGYALRGQIFQDCSLLVKTKSVTDEALINAETVHAFCLEQMFLNQYASELKKVHMEVRNRFKVRGFLYGFTLCIPIFACTTCMFLGSYLIKAKEIPFTNVFKVTEALILGSVLVAHLVIFSPNVVKAEESSSRVLSLIKRKPLICSFSNDTQSKWKTQGHIRFYKVFFNHPTYSGLPQLIKFSLQIQEGEVVALVGAASSIPIHLLLRFYNPSEGSLLIDGRDICGINLWTIRRQIGLVDGDPSFFNRTVAENIGYGEQVKEAKRDDIINAAKEANIHNYITTLSEGYDTVLNSNVKMTSSQKFRMSLARALLHDPPILLMDNLQQAENEDSKLLVESAVKHACLGRTCLLVSQYVQSPTQLANIICLLRSGSVVEEGAHKTLMEHKGLYYQLYCHQELQSHSTSSNI